MRVVGLFVGVDVQQDETIRQLSFAGDDAEWLWACFADMNEQDPSGHQSDTLLLRGAEATCSRVSSALDHLVQVGQREEVDLAIVHFSCHGTPEGYLLLSDTEQERQTQTGLALREIAQRVEAIRAERVVTSFDTCFSGGATTSAGELQAIDGQMRALGRANRAVIAAARATEQAFESPRLGHGLLSYGLIQGLDGRSVIERGEIPIGRWLDHAVSVVNREAANEGVLQEAVQYFEWEGRPAMPAYPPGPQVSALRARGQVYQVGGHLSDLTPYGFTSVEIAALQSRTRGEPMNDMQVHAVNAGVIAGRNILVAAPTSSGKTFVGELAVLGAWRRRRRAVILLPTRALASEKWIEFQSTFTTAGLRAVRSYGGVDDDDAALSTHHFDVAFLTYEKFLLLALTRRRLLEAIGTVVLDEIHLLSDAERGRSVELLLTLLKLRRRSGHPLQVVALSAALGEMNGLETWLDAELITETQRPVPLREGVVSPSGRFYYRDSDTGAHGVAQIFAPIPGRREREWDSSLYGRVAHAVTRALSEDETERVLLFRAHRPDARSLAGTLARDLGLPRCALPLSRIGGDATATGRDDSRATKELVGCLERGLAFHISDLEQNERGMVEEAFRSGDLRCLVATSTLAMGINTPATSVVVVDHERFGGPGEMVPYSVTEYKNMAGRAGRWIPGSRSGRSLLVAADDRAAQELFQQYVLGDPEPMTSRLAELDREDLVIALLACIGTSTESGLRSAIEETFDGFTHRADPMWRTRLRNDVRSAVDALSTDHFVQTTDNGVIELTEIGRICGREGLSVLSARGVMAAAKLILEDGEPLDETALIGLAQITCELDHVFTPVEGNDHEQWPGIVSGKFLRDRDVLRAVLLNDPAKALRRLKRFYAVARWLQGERIAVIEQEFAAFHPEWKRNAPVAGIIRQITVRTGHVLRPVGALLATRFPELHEAIRQRVVDLQPRLEFGVPREGANFVRYRFGLTRGEVRQLQSLRIYDVEGLYAALKGQEPQALGIFGSSKAARVMQAIERQRPTAERRRQADAAAQLALFDQVPAASVL